jgi:hypothetical protein
MPTVFRQGPYRFYFPISVANSIGFNAIELGEIQRLVDQHRAQILEAWREHFRK